MTSQLMIPWAYWRRHRVGLTVAAGWWLALVTGAAFGPAGVMGPVVGATLFATFGLTVLYLVAVFCHALETDIAAGESGYPRRAFTLPVPTWALAAWPMGLAAAAALLVWLAARSAGSVVFPSLPWWPGLLVAAGLAWFQVLTWWPFGVSRLRLVGLAVGGAAALAAINLTHDNAAVAANRGAILAALWAGAFVTAAAGLSRARRGDAMISPPAADTPRHAGPVDDRSWTPAQAQSWFERRRAGLPHLMGHVVLGLSVPLLGVAAADTLGRALVVPVAGLSATEAFAVEYLLYVLLVGGMSALGHGVTFGTIAAGPRGFGSPSTFLMTRPLSGAAILQLKSRQALRGAALGVAAVFIGYAVWVGVAGRVDALAELRRGPLGAMSDLQCLVAAGLFVVAAVAWTWWASLAGLWVGLAGRMSVTYSAVAGLTVAAVIALAMLQELSNLAWLAENAGPIAAVLLTAKGVASVWVGRRLLRRGAVSRGQLRKYVSRWVGVAAASFLTLWCLGVPAGPSVLLAAVPVPLNRVGVAMLTLHAARHR